MRAEARAPSSAETARDVGKPHLLPDAVRGFDEVGFVTLPRRDFTRPYTPGCYELARVSIPKDSVGVVVQLWQWLATPYGPVVGPLDHRRLGQHVAVTWSLVLEDRAPLGELRRPEGMNPQAPSSRIPPYGAIDDLRFPWGSHTPVKVFAPERSTVSLWARVVSPGGELRQVGGRLSGYTQHGKSPAAYENLARG